jgi:polyisoprenoid-binding protein YceI
MQICSLSFVCILQESGMFKPSLLKIAALGLFVSSIAQAEPLKVNSCAVTFLATGKPGFLKVNGQGADCKGTLESDAKGISGEVTVPMSKFVTGIDLRDDHMKKKYFEVEKYPDAILKIAKFETSGKEGKSEGPFTGTLNFHGVEKPVTGTAVSKVSGGKNSIEADFTLNLDDYKLEVPTYAGVTVANKVDVKAVLETEVSAVAAAAPAPAPAKAAEPAKAPAKPTGKK